METQVSSQPHVSFQHDANGLDESKEHALMIWLSTFPELGMEQMNITLNKIHMEGNSSFHS